jgi:branched-chain amino acid transport system permease protein
LSLIRRFRDQSATVPVLLLLGLFLSWAAQEFGLVNPYVQLVLVTIGINAILAASLNLVNGYMGEFSVGHAGFMAVGAYTASVLTVRVLTPGPARWLFPLAVLLGGAAAALVGLVLAVLSFRTRGDYLAIVTLAFGSIVKSVLEHVDAVGGARGFLGMQKLTSLPWTFAFAALTVWVIRNVVFSGYGRGVLSIREDELAANLMGVNTRKAKVLAFAVSSFFAGVAGGLYAHLLQFINPRMFDIVKSTDVLVMVYLGGIGSLFGSILGATVFTILLEVLRPFGMLRMVVMPLTLVLLRIFRPRGIFGHSELRWLMPLRERLLRSALPGRVAAARKEAAVAAPLG